MKFVKGADLVATLGLTYGDHQLYVCTKNSAAIFSLTEGRKFKVLPSIVAAEYFFNTDPGLGAGNPLIVSDPSDSVNTTFSIPTSGLIAGNYSLYICTRNSEEKWSLAEPQTINRSSDPGLSVKLFLQGFYLGRGQMASVMDPLNRPEVCDSITIALADTVATYSTISSINTILYTNGMVQLIYPSSYFGRSYYLVVRHRNSVETWSKSPVNLTRNVVLFDFATGGPF